MTARSTDRYLTSVPDLLYLFILFIPFPIVLTRLFSAPHRVTIKEHCPNLYNYLLQRKDVLLSREYFVKSKKAWYELWNPRKMNHFYNRKFVFSEIGFSLHSVFVSVFILGYIMPSSPVKFILYFSAFHYNRFPLFCNRKAPEIRSFRFPAPSSLPLSGTAYRDAFRRHTGAGRALRKIRRKYHGCFLAEIRKNWYNTIQIK